jgi:hypothetical protein
VQNKAKAPSLHKGQTGRGERSTTPILLSDEQDTDKALQDAKPTQAFSSDTDNRSRPPRRGGSSHWGTDVNNKQKKRASIEDEEDPQTEVAPAAKEDNRKLQPQDRQAPNQNRVQTVIADVHAAADIIEVLPPDFVSESDSNAGQSEAEDEDSTEEGPGGTDQFAAEVSSPRQQQNIAGPEEAAMPPPREPREPRSRKRTGNAQTRGGESHKVHGDNSSNVRCDKSPTQSGNKSSTQNGDKSPNQKRTLRTLRSNTSRQSSIKDAFAQRSLSAGPTCGPYGRKPQGDSVKGQDSASSKPNANTS